jgi:hypothetical protein
MTTQTRIALALSLASLVSACAGGARTSGTVGPAGGTITSASGVSLRIPAGALSQPTELRLVETEPGSGEMERIQIEPNDLKLALPASLTFKVQDGNVRLAEVEHGPEGEVKTELEKHRHDSLGEVEVEVEHGAEVEMEHGAACATACDTGFECDDGVCKADDLLDDNGVDAPTTTPDDNGTDPAPHA